MSRSTPDPMGHDDDVLTQSETLDEDNMGVDPLEGGMDPADGWSASNQYGTTAIEQATDRPLTERLEGGAPRRQHRGGAGPSCRRNPAGGARRVGRR